MRDVLVFYVTGNPGLIGYYINYLSTLHSHLESRTTMRNYYYYGSSHAGYDTITGPNIFTNLPKFSTVKAQTKRPKGGPFTIEDQIAFKISELESVVTQHQNSTGRELDVVIIGHSMGCYIILELLHKLQSRNEINKPLGAILLFPTVIEIAHSSSGLTLGKAFGFPQFANIVQMIVNFLVFILPFFIIRFILMTIAVHPSDGAEVTLTMLRTPNLVRQVLLLAREEMHVITTDKWDESIWGAAPPSRHSSPQLLFFFAEKDHWVADRTREDLIRLRGNRKWGPRMVIDNTGVTHAFCFNDSENVAERCVLWVEEMVGQQKQ